MPLTEAQLNQMYTDLGCDAVWPMRGNLEEALTIYGNANGTAGAGIAYTTAGPESCRSGSVATFAGGSTSFANLGSLANLMSRISTGGGFTVSLFFKIASGVTTWKIGTDVSTTGPSLWYACGASNNQARFARNSQSSDYIDLETAFATALRNDTWHCLCLVYNYFTGVLYTYIDGELWSEGSTISTRGTASDGLTTDISNFMLGGFSSNGGTTASSPFASAFCEVAVASRVFSHEEVLKLYELGIAASKPASSLPLRNGPRADYVARRVLSNLRTSRPLIIALGDSMLTLNGAGFVSDPYLRRRINQLSGGRLANWQPLRVGDASDAYAPPGYVASITAGSTSKYTVGLRTNDLYNSDYSLGSDPSARRTMAFDASKGIKILVGVRKEPGGRGPLTYVVRGSSLRAPSLPLSGSENYQASLATGTAFTAEQLTGDGTSTAYTYITVPPSRARHNYLQVELTNGGSTTLKLVDLDFVSVANADTGPWCKIAARGGYNITSFYGNHPYWTKMVRDLRAFLNEPPLHFLLMLGANDGSTIAPTTWRTNHAAFVSALFADFPDATLTFATTPPVSGQYSNGIRANARAANLTGAATEYAEANNQLLINNVNSRMECIRQQGWQPWNQSTAHYTVVGEYDPATAYTAGTLAYCRTYDADGYRRYFYSRFTQTGEPLLNTDKWNEVSRYINSHPSDLLHHSELGQTVNIDNVLAGFVGSDATGR